jgi:hypothetical protein
MGRSQQVVRHLNRRCAAHLHASTARDFDAVFATLAQLRAGGLVIGADVCAGRPDNPFGEG